MDFKAIWSTMTAKAGKEAEAEAFLARCLKLAEKEAGTTRFLVLRIAPGKYAIFDTFATPEAFQAHLTGEVRAYVEAHVQEFFDGFPEIVPCEILGTK